MRVLITGGGGNLGRVLAPTLDEAGYQPILMDNRELETAHQVVRGDVRDKTELLQDLRDVDVVVHAAALHGIHLERYTTDDFWNLNVVGTRNVYEAAREAGDPPLIVPAAQAFGRLWSEQEAVRGASGLLRSPRRDPHHRLQAGDVRPGELRGVWLQAAQGRGRRQGRGASVPARAR